MALVLEVIPYILQFKFDARTSRGRLSMHQTWFLKVWDATNPAIVGYGECAPFEGLSIDDTTHFEADLRQAISKLDNVGPPESLQKIQELVDTVDPALPAVRFGLETALRDLYYGGQMKIFDCPFYLDRAPLKINGLIWMGSKDLMLKRLKSKIQEGFETIKFKIGSLDAEEEMAVLKTARTGTGGNKLTIRVDANGAYAPEMVPQILERLHEFDIHSIEQPIKAGQQKAMAEVCAHSPVPVALDEELIGIFDADEKRALLETIRPQYIVLKPTLLGGFSATEEWIRLAEELGIGWWVTSALESNIGLNAICQFTSRFKPTLPQGLGTGGLYHNNITSPLCINRGAIYLDPAKRWNLRPLFTKK